MQLQTVKFFSAQRPSVEERLTKGKLQRRQIPRSSLDQFVIRKESQVPVDILQQQASTRHPDLVPIRHARMAANPFAFFRGGAALMAHDLATLPSVPLTVQLCGDMHVSNFGLFSTTEQRLVFGINDFDETLPGNFDWDIKRLCTSAMIAAEYLGMSRSYGEEIIRLIVSNYRRYMSVYAHKKYLELAREQITEKELLNPSFFISNSSEGYLRKQIEKARKNTNEGVIGKLTIKGLEGLRLIEKPPLIMHFKTFRGRPIAKGIDESLSSYMRSLLSDRQHVMARYQLKDVARKVVGVGSVGLGCWVLYLEGVNDADPLFLQYKQAQRSVLAPYFPDQQFKTQGERVVHGQRLIQGAPDFFLGFGQNHRSAFHFYLRQLRDMKGGINFGDGGITAKEFPDYARLIGHALANAHARSGDPALLAGYCGNGTQLDDAMVRFSHIYSDQNMADYETFLAAIKSGKLACAQDNF